MVTGTGIPTNRATRSGECMAVVYGEVRVFGEGIRLRESARGRLRGLERAMRSRTVIEMATAEDTDTGYHKTSVAVTATGECVGQWLRIRESTICGSRV